MRFAGVVVASFLMSCAQTPPAEDPLQWLEEVEGMRALTWVRERNAESQAILMQRPEFAPMRAALLDVLNSKERIPEITRHGEQFYNLWQDETNKRGLWRRTTLVEYAKPEPQWETVLDLDALGRAENEGWVWGGASCLAPDSSRCLVSLSRGGADAVVVREFDLATLRFVEGGFELPEAKTDVDWLDRDTIYVGTDFGPGSLTDSGYPRIVKRWSRGTPLERAVTVFEGERSDVSAWVQVDRTPGFERTLFGRSVDFYSARVFLLQGDQLVEIDKPGDATLTFVRQWLLLELRSDYTASGTTWRKGSLLAAPATAHLAGERNFEALFEPTATRSLAGFVHTKSHLLLDVLDNVASRIEELRFDDASWRRRAVQAPLHGAINLQSLHEPLLADDPLAEHYLQDYTDFVTPDSLLLRQAGGDTQQVLKSRTHFFDAGGMRVEQRFAHSKDGTRIPYFVVWPRGAVASGTTATLLYGYGGFEISLQPWYSGGYGRAWYERGGALVVANIRGGGEFGPAWHQAALRQNRQRAFDDFIAVAEDLIRTRVTSPRHLGMMGGSNGGLLVAAALVQRPELFGAVVCEVPLLDMRRYHKLLAGASWIAEYGDPDRPDEWAWIEPYSPYQNVRADRPYPPVLFTTSTRDDRVHPGHARKMAARMLAQGHEVLYYENIEGGHGRAADNEQRAHMQALEFTFLWRQLGRGSP